MTWVIVSATVRKSQLEVENVWQMAWRDDEIPSPGDNVIRGFYNAYQGDPTHG